MSLKPSTSEACLRFLGDDLDPDKLTELLGAKPTKSEMKGDEIFGKVTGHKRIARTGVWRLKATGKEPANLDVQISEILDQLTEDLCVWQDLTARFSSDIFCGFFMATGNDGFGLSKTTLERLVVRGRKIEFDLYDPSDD